MSAHRAVGAQPPLPQVAFAPAAPQQNGVVEVGLGVAGGISVAATIWYYMYPQFRLTGRGTTPEVSN